MSRLFQATGLPGPSMTDFVEGTRGVGLRCADTVFVLPGSPGRYRCLALRLLLDVFGDVGENAESAPGNGTGRINFGPPPTSWNFEAHHNSAEIHKRTGSPAGKGLQSTGGPQKIVTDLN